MVIDLRGYATLCRAYLMKLDKNCNKCNTGWITDLRRMLWKRPPVRRQKFQGFLLLLDDSDIQLVVGQVFIDVISLAGSLDRYLHFVDDWSF